MRLFSKEPGKKVIELTPEACDYALRLRKETASAESCLRLAVKGDGCAGLVYTMRFDTEIRPTDHLFTFVTLQVCVDMKSYLYLDGTKLEVIKDQSGERFFFNNPKVIRTCSCHSASRTDSPFGPTC